MTRFVVDASAVLHLASAGFEVSGAHKLLAPTLLRSQTLSALHEAVERGEISTDVARDRLTRIGRLPIRLLGDAVLRRRAWDLADQLGWASTYNAEYRGPHSAAGRRVRSPWTSNWRAASTGSSRPCRSRRFARETTADPRRMSRAQRLGDATRPAWLSASGSSMAR